MRERLPLRAPVSRAQKHVAVKINHAVHPKVSATQVKVPQDQAFGPNGSIPCGTINTVWRDQADCLSVRAGTLNYADTELCSGAGST